MDNASKALVMVGAILISVMLISLGVFLFTYARDQAESTTGMMDSTKVGAFNAQFLPYCGDNIKGTSVVTLISNVTASNVQNPEFPVETPGFESSADVTRTSTYTVEEVYDEDDGHIVELTITENT